jgi:hypothetical protein
MIYNKPLNYNLSTGTFPFIWPSLIYFYSLLLHFATRKVSLYLKIKKTLTEIWVKLGFFYMPSLREIYVVSIISFCIFTVLRNKAGFDTESQNSSYLPYAQLFNIIFLVPASILTNEYYNKIYSKKKLLTIFISFLLLSLIGTLFTGSRRIFTYFLATAFLSVSYTLKPSSFFLKKKLLKNTIFTVVFFFLFQFINQLLASVATNRNKTSNLSVTERVFANSEINETTETDQETSETYISGESGIVKRMIFNKYLDNDLFYFNQVPSNLKKLVLEELRTFTLSSMIPAIFFKKKTDKRDLGNNYGTVLDTFRYYSTGKNLKSFLEGSKFFEDYLIVQNPILFSLILFLIMPLLFCFYDSFTIRKKTNLFLPIMILPLLAQNSAFLYNMRILIIPRYVLMNIMINLILIILLYYTVRLLLKLFGFSK